MLSHTQWCVDLHWYFQPHNYPLHSHFYKSHETSLAKAIDDLQFANPVAQSLSSFFSASQQHFMQLITFFWVPGLPYSLSVLFFAPPPLPTYPKYWDAPRVLASNLSITPLDSFPFGILGLLSGNTIYKWMTVLCFPISSCPLTISAWVVKRHPEF